MRLLQAWHALGPVDWKSVYRDPLLKWMILYPLFLALVIRLGLPHLNAYLMQRWAINLDLYSPIIMGFAILITPMLSGIVIGFLFLDQRDDHTLTAVSVTPISLSGYLVYRLSLPVVASLVINLFMFPLTGLVRLNFSGMLLVSISAAPLAPFYALLLGAFGQNKVQGFALTKTTGVLLLPPVLAWFVDFPWQWLMALDPLYWPVKVLWLLLKTNTQALWFFVTGLGLHVLILRVLYNRFIKQQV